MKSKIQENKVDNAHIHKNSIQKNIFSLLAAPLAFMEAKRTMGSFPKLDKTIGSVVSEILTIKYFYLCIRRD